MPKKKFWKARLVDGFQPVMIDLDVHKALEAARTSFAEPPNAILRRLLGLEQSKAKPAPVKDRGERDVAAAAPDPGPTRRDAPDFPDGSMLRANYCGVKVSGRVRDGAWEVDGSRFSLSSIALIANLDSRSEAPDDLKAWQDWEILPPGAEQWRPLAEPSRRRTG